jgi:hypothetical protein
MVDTPSFYGAVNVLFSRAEDREGVWRKMGWMAVGKIGAGIYGRKELKGV